MKHAWPVVAATLLAALALLASSRSLFATQIAVTDVAGFGNGRGEAASLANATDGDTETYASTGSGGDAAGPVYLAIGFARAPVNRIRLWKRGYGEQGVRNLAIQYTTGGGPLERRTWANVAHLATGYHGEFLHSIAVNADGTVDGDDHDSPPIPDGEGHLWASLTFDTVLATGLRITFSKPGPTDVRCDARLRNASCARYRVAEFQAHYEAPPDRTAPITIATLSPPPNAAGWNNADVTVYLHATDDPGGSGVERVTYSTAGAQTATPTTVTGASAAVLITAEGTTTVSYAATDKAGNAEAPQSLTVKLDKTDPAVTGMPSHCLLWPTARTDVDGGDAERNAMRSPARGASP